MPLAFTLFHIPARIHPEMKPVKPHHIIQYATKYVRTERLLRVFLHLASYINYADTTGFVFVLRETIVKGTDMHRQHVNSSLKKLEQQGHITYAECVETKDGLRSGWYLNAFSEGFQHTELYNTSEPNRCRTRNQIGAETKPNRCRNETKSVSKQALLTCYEHVLEHESLTFLRQGAAKSRETDGSSTHNNENDLTVTLPKPCCTPETTGVESEKTEMNVGKPRRGPGEYEEPASGDQTPQPSRSALTQRKASQKLYQDCRSLILHITQYTHVGPDFYVDPPQMSTWKSIIKIHGLDDAKRYADSLFHSPRHKAEFITQALPFTAKTLERFIRTHGSAIKTGQTVKESVISLDNWEGAVAD